MTQQPNHMLPQAPQRERKWAWPYTVLAAFFAVALVISGCNSGSSSNSNDTNDQFQDTGDTADLGNPLSEATNIFLDDFLEAQGYGTDYVWFHGSTSPDGGKLLVTTNIKDGNGITDKVLLMTLDTAHLETGEVEVLDHNEIEGSEGTTQFRSSWTPDGDRIALAAGDRMLVVDANDLTVIHDTAAEGADHIHDARATSDGDYAVLTVRDRTDAAWDGVIQLYDMNTGKMVGEDVSVCGTCHEPGSAMVTSVGNPDGKAILCGLDGDLIAEQTSTGATGNYVGTIYVAGHGGHYAGLELTIDPSATTPITVNNGVGDKIDVSTNKLDDGTSSHKLHDARLDGDTLYWSTYNRDANDQAHYGALDLANNNNLLSDTPIDIPTRAGGTSIYCASGQTSDFFMPMTMTNEAYITVIPKNDITEGTAPDETEPDGSELTSTNVFLDEFLDAEGYGTDYQWFHGSSSTDQSELLVTTNIKDENGITNNILLMILDASKMENGEVDVLQSNVIQGSDGATQFRSSWTPQDDKIVLAAGDRMLVVDAADLTVIHDTAAEGADHIHDARATSDGDYAVLTVRDRTDAAWDGVIQLYDVNTGEMVGEDVSVCGTCHAPGSAMLTSVGNPEGKAILCGLDGDLIAEQTSTGATGNYVGTIYVAGHGGHYAGLELTIDPSATTPITVDNGVGDKIEVSTNKLDDGTSSHKLHDARLDGDTLYWSTYNRDANDQAHYGALDLADNNNLLSDTPVDIPTRAGGTSIYCASGQTSNVFMPMTMTNEAYITVIPKNDIN